MSELKTLKDLKLEEEFAEYLAFKVYHPVKEELKGGGRTYSLGQRLELFKGFIEKKHIELRQAAINRVKNLLSEFKEICCAYHIEKDGRTVFGIEEEAFSKLNTNQVGCVASINSYLEFFNITEEELE